jgi:putative addiction module CopG family antidote
MEAVSSNGADAMTINIPDELASFVEQAVASGQFASQEQVVGEALRLLQQQQAENRPAKRTCGWAIEGANRDCGRL